MVILQLRTGHRLFQFAGDFVCAGSAVGWFLLCLLSLSSGCIIDARHTGTSRTGFLSIDWTIEGVDDPYLCDYYVVDAMELVLYDRFGYIVTEIEAPCEDFTVTIELSPGIYDADATLVGFRDEAATFTEPLDGLDVVPDTELVVEMDFPPRSFL